MTTRRGDDVLAPLVTRRARQVSSSLALGMGHVSQGGWLGAYRMTFFFGVSRTPPFGLECVTPMIAFGMSDSLEYATHVELHDDHLYVSVGVDNCWTALVKLQVHRRTSGGQRRLTRAHV